MTTGSARLRGRGWLAALIAVALLAALTDAPGSRAAPGQTAAQTSAQTSAQAGAQTGEAAPREKPNVILVVADDLSMDLVRTMSSLRRMQRTGASYPHSYVVDSLCCVSRSSLFTGQYPHQTGVLANIAGPPGIKRPKGGWRAYQEYGNGRRSLAPRLQRAGYRTGFVGKFLNQYSYRPGRALPPVPPGWDEFRAILGGAYSGWGYDAVTSVDGTDEIRGYPAPAAWLPGAFKDRWYAGSVIADLATRFVDEQEGADSPYFLQVTPYAPHAGFGKPPYADEPIFPPAFADRPGPGNPDGNCGAVECEDLGLADLPGFNDPLDDNRPVRRDGRPARGWKVTAKTDLPEEPSVQRLRSRAQMVQSIDRMMHDLLDRVEGENTVVIFTSDNGFHLGQHGFATGKGLAYESDIRVPLFVAGPGIEPGRRPDVVSNIDLAPTIERLAGLTPPDYRAGLSLLPSLRGRPVDSGADYAFVEHSWMPKGKDDPDRSAVNQIPGYLAVRSRQGLLIRYDLERSPRRTRYAYEFYSYRDNAWERRNQFTDPRRQRAVRALLGRLERFDDCSSVTRGDPWPRRCAALRHDPPRR